MNQEFGFEEPTFSVEIAIQMLQTQMNFLGVMWLEMCFSVESRFFAIFEGICRFLVRFS